MKPDVIGLNELRFSPHEKACNKLWQLLTLLAISCNTKNNDSLDCQAGTDPDLILHAHGEYDTRITHQGCRACQVIVLLSILINRC